MFGEKPLHRSREKALHSTQASPLKKNTSYKAHLSSLGKINAPAPVTKTIQDTHILKI